MVLNFERSMVDKLGVFASMACMLHCLLSSVAVAVLPYYGGIIWQSESTHQLLALLAILICMIAAIQSYRNQHDKKVASLFIIGTCFLTVATFLLPESLHQQYEVYMLSLGSTFLMTAHVLNIRQLCRCT